MKSIRNKLSLATCSLLTTGNAAAEAIENAWDLDSSYLHYSEDDRITVNKLIGSAKGFVSTRDTAAIKVVFDSMSGATPTGAVKNTNPLTSTGASGGTGPTGGGTAAPLAEFDDTRVAVSLDWAHEHIRSSKGFFLPVRSTLFSLLRYYEKLKISKYICFMDKAGLVVSQIN